MNGAESLLGTLLARRISATAARVTDRAGNIGPTVWCNGRIVGGTNGAGIFYPQGTGNPTTGPANQNRVTGNPPLAPST